MNALDSLLANPNQCRRVIEGVAVHWYPTPNPQVGDTCHCGEQTFTGHHFEDGEVGA